MLSGGLKVVGIVLFTVLFSSRDVRGINPFSPGQYKTAEYVVSPKEDKSPLHSTIYFPLTSGNYTPILFIGGMYGYVLAEFYAPFLSNIASHGYIVIGIDAIYPVPSMEHLQKDRYENSRLWDVAERERINLSNKRIDSYLKQNTWLRQNINNKTYAIPDWTKTAIACHSAGCDDTLQMVEQQHDLAQASIFFDPMSTHSKKMKPFKSSVRTLATMSQFSEEGFPGCCIAGMGYKRIYDLMTCLKVRMEVMDFGHCGFLEEGIWNVCHETQICKTSSGTRVNEYKSFIIGVVDAFLRWTLYGETDMEKYVTDQTYMPLNVTNLAYNTTCNV